MGAVFEQRLPPRTLHFPHLKGSMSLEDNALQTLEQLGYSIWVTAKKVDGDERRIVCDRKPSLILRRIQQPRKQKERTECLTEQM
jgi:hypothetical protein